MVAENIDGNALAARIRQRIRDEIAKKQETSKRFKPSLTIVQGQPLIEVARPLFVL
jgi:methylenetetrahydrofolate dehydrogenase (NADP+)/methenyltetrahydrofolate cyclohydrolase/formyltetrahydrofolate synthetase